jgi:hypothetical protein
MSEPAERHLSREAVSEYLSGAPAAMVVPGTPVCRIEFEPPRREVSLRTPDLGQGEPDLSVFEHVQTRVFAEDGTQWAQLTVRYADNGHEAYLLLSDIADMIQQSGVSFASAVSSALGTFGDLLTRAGGLSAERQTGLYGELLFLESCIQQSGMAGAVGSWKGFAANEHDFVFSQACFEIKTTMMEKRRHTIGGLDQLEPTPGTPLWLVSVQLTSATPSSGRTLAELVDDLRAAAGPSRTALEVSLQQAGWRERDRAIYRNHLKLRSTPSAYLIDNSFPVLDRRAIKAGCARPELIVSATYSVDVTILTPAVPPYPAYHFVKGST